MIGFISPKAKLADKIFPSGCGQMTEYLNLN